VDRGNFIRLDAHRLVRQVKDKQGRTKTILSQVSLPIEPGQFVALVGGSGTGKSTLLKTLLGIEPTQEGGVFLNGDNLRLNWGILCVHTVVYLAIALWLQKRKDIL